mmetsp:Transcript_21454/g.40345  ORF Transcript_21454/g.40345 Transcript_21454/m.40345 type:complete len:228 (+) Transcript_21454:46-729(+)
MLCVYNPSLSPHAAFLVSSVFEQAQKVFFEPQIPARMTEFIDGLRLYHPDSLLTDAYPLRYFCAAQKIAVIQAEPQADNHPLPAVEVVHALEEVAPELARDGVLLRTDAFPNYAVAEDAVVVGAVSRLLVQTDGLLRGLHDEVDLALGDVEVLGDFRRGGFPPEAGLHESHGFLDVVDLEVNGDGEAYYTGVVGDGAGDALPDPVRCVGAKFETFGGVESVRSLEET